MWSRFCCCHCCKHSAAVDEDSLAGSYFRRATLPIGDLQGLEGQRAAKATSSSLAVESQSKLDVNARSEPSATGQMISDMDERVITYILGIFRDGEQLVMCEALSAPAGTAASLAGSSASNEEVHHMLAIFGRSSSPY